MNAVPNPVPRLHPRPSEAAFSLFAACPLPCPLCSRARTSANAACSSNSKSKRMNSLQATSHFAQTLIAHLIYALALLASTHLCTLHSPRLRPKLGPATPAPHTPLLRLHLQPNAPARYPALPAPWLPSPCCRCHYDRSLHANAQMPTCSELHHQ